MIEGWAIDEHPSDAKVIRNALGSLIGSAGGLVAAGGLEGTQKGTPAMAVLVKGGTPAEGGLFIPGYTTSTGPYFFHNTATYEQPIEAAGASNPRVDTVVARMYDTAVDSSGKHEPVIQVLRGEEVTGAKLEGSKSKGLAAVPKNCYVLFYVEVKAKAASIVTADIENVATVMSLRKNPVPYQAQITASSGEPSLTEETWVTVQVPIEGKPAFIFGFPCPPATKWEQSGVPGTETVRILVGGVLIAESKTGAIVAGTKASYRPMP